MAGPGVELLAFEAIFSAFFVMPFIDTPFFVFAAFCLLVVYQIFFGYSDC